MLEITLFPTQIVADSTQSEVVLLFEIGVIDNRVKQLMSRASSLPERIRYLQPFRKKYNGRGAEKLNEDAGTESLLSLLHKRVKDLSREEAIQTLTEDAVLLQEWLAAPEQANDCLHFAQGFWLISSSQDILNLVNEWAKPLPPPPEAVIELPKGARVKRYESKESIGFLIRWKGFLIGRGAQTEQTLANLITGYQGPQIGVTIVSSRVRFGEAEGLKVIRSGVSWAGPYKDIHYGLTVPGGHVHTSLSLMSNKKVARENLVFGPTGVLIGVKEGYEIDRVNWDESPVEALFSTIRVTQRTTNE